METKDFLVNVGPHGTFKPSKKYHTTPNDIDVMFQKFEADHVKKITLYFHGGLVNEKTGVETAIKMANHFDGIGQRPICFAWETGLVETVTSNIGKISETKLFNKLIQILVKKLASKLGFDLAEGRGGGESISQEEIEAELCQEIPFQNYTRINLEAKGRGTDPSDNLPSRSEDLEGEFMYEVESDYELISILSESELSVPLTQGGSSRGIISTALLVKSFAKIAFRVIKRFVNKRDHDFYPTLIEELMRELYVAELGAWVWNNMKVKSGDMWNDNTGISGVNQFAGRYLLDSLAAYRKNHPDVQVNLVGHSAGSIAICNLLKTSAVAHPELIFNNILFMAPACRIDLFRDEIVQHPERFNKFRMFTMTDENEKRDMLVPYVYTHSLLYLISGILEDQGNDFDAHILGLERNIKCIYPYDQVQEIMDTHAFIYEAGKDRVAFSKTDDTAPDGLKTGSLSHGGFDDDGPTIDSLKYVLQQ